MKSKKTEKKNLYRGITHFCPMWLLPLWKKFLCSRNIHAFDECRTSGLALWEEGSDSYHNHYLSCDACGLIVEIYEINDGYCEDKEKDN